MTTEKKKGMFRRTLGLYRGLRIPWHLYICQMLLGIIGTKVMLLSVPYSSSMQIGDISQPGMVAGYLLFIIVTPLVNGIIPSIPAFYASAMMNKRLQDKLINHSMRLSMSSYERNASQIVSWITRDCGDANTLLVAMFGFITSIVSAYMSITSMSAIDVSMVGILPVIIVWTLFSVWLEGRLMFLRERRGRRASAEMTAYLAEHLSFFTQVKQLHSEDEETALGMAATKSYFMAELYKALLSQVSGIFSGSLNNMLSILVFVMGVPLVREGKITLTELVSFQQYLIMAYGTLMALPSLYTTWMTYNGTLYYIAGLAAEPEEVYERRESMDVEDRDLAFDNVSFGYGEKIVLQNVSFTIPKGKLTMLVGPNGSGKTTIFKLIERFYTPTSGEIRFGDTPAEDFHLQEWRQSIAYVLQEPQLFEGTIRENLVYGMDREVTDQELEAAARLACADTFIRDLPGGYDYVIGQNGSRLSGGQRQRLAIARAVILDPAYLLLDEATSNMDIYSEREVTTALMRLMKGRTTVMISHNMDMLRRADHVVALHDGVVEASGPREEVLQKSPTLQALIQANA